MIIDVNNILTPHGKKSLLEEKIDVNTILTPYGKRSLFEEKIVNTILTPYGKKCLLEKKDEKYGVEAPSSRDRKKDWKKQIYNILDKIGKDDMFELNTAYQHEKADDAVGKFKALKTVVGELLKVTAGLAAALIITRHKYYDPTKLRGAVSFPGTRNNPTGNMADAIRTDLDEIDKKFKLNFKLDKKLNKIRNQTDDAEEFLEGLVEYIDWHKYSNWSKKGKVTSVGDMLMIGSKNGKLMPALERYAQAVL